MSRRGRAGFSHRSVGRTEIEKEFQRFVGPDGFEAPCELLIGIGTK
jgi:hypothetical protein